MGLTLGAMAVAALGTTAAGGEDKPVCLRRAELATASCGGRLELGFLAAITPDKLPKEVRAPVALRLEGKISTPDGTQPAALREATIAFDRDGAIDAEGLPVCPRRTIETDVAAARRACRASIVGTGAAHVAIAAGDSVSLPLTLFNGGVDDGTTTVFIQSSLAVATPTPLVAVVKLRKAHEHGFGLEAITTIPAALWRYGSVLDFSFRIKRLFADRHARRSYASARCSDGHLETLMSALFSDGTQLRGLVVRQCAPTG